MPHGPRFYKNTLTTPEITQELLQETLVNLQTAVHNGVQLIESKHPAGEDDGRGIFSGDLGTSPTTTSSFFPARPDSVPSLGN
jgi:hypothetical protein